MLSGCVSLLVSSWSLWSESSLPSSMGPHSLRSVTSESKISRPYSGLGSLWVNQQLCWSLYLTIYQKQCVKSNSTGMNNLLWYTKYPCSSPAGVYTAALRYFLGMFVTFWTHLFLSYLPIFPFIICLSPSIPYQLPLRHKLLPLHLISMYITHYWDPYPRMMSL